MCGIYGYIGKQNAYDKVIDGLSLLQYRGYDSCGVAYYTNEFKTIKAVGTLSNLQKCEIKPTIAFGHTRWATNGVVNVNNAHPHVSYNNEYTIVHNGIIKNSDYIKQQLIKKNITFYSETDTEVIANYLTTINITTDLKDIFKTLKGTFSLIIGTKSGDIYLIKEFSPLHVLKAEDGIYISSDISSLPSGELYSLKDGDILKISNNNISNYNNDEIIYKKHINQKEQYILEKFPHYMIKEIFETPQAIYNTYQNIKDIDFHSIFSKYNKFTLLGCGTAYNSCLIGEYLMQSQLEYNITTVLASNYKITKQISKKHLHIIVSQSGETADCIKVAEQIKQYGGEILLITNEPLSTMARLADKLILTKANKELAVASTKTYSCQVFIFAFACQKIINDNYDLDILQFTKNLTKYIERINIYEVAIKLKDIKHLIMIAKDIDYLTLLEASLKIREIDYIYTLPMFSSELKHGTLSLIENGTIVLTLNTDKSRNKLETTINEINSRQGSVIELEKLIPTITDNEFYKPIYGIIPFQLLSYQIAILHKRNPDMPRNLAKSVTVE